MTYSFLELLIFLLINSSRYLVFFLTMPKKYFMWTNTNFTVNQSRDISKHFHLFLILMLKKSIFYVKLILYTNNFYNHIFRSSRLHMFFKISALKNFAIIKIKKRLQHRCSCKKQPHDVNILIYFFTEHLSLATFVL